MAFSGLLKLPCREIREEKNPSYGIFEDNVSEAAEITTTPLPLLYINSWNAKTYRWPVTVINGNPEPLNFLHHSFQIVLKADYLSW